MEKLDIFRYSVILIIMEYDFFNYKYYDSLHTLCLTRL
jgi:hypothetical protein